MSSSQFLILMCAIYIAPNTPPAHRKVFSWLFLIAAFVFEFVL